MSVLLHWLRYSYESQLYSTCHCSVCYDPGCSQGELTATGRVPLFKQTSDWDRLQACVSQFELYKKCQKCGRVYYIVMKGDVKPRNCQTLTCQICGDPLEDAETEVHQCHKCKTRNITQALWCFMILKNNVHVPFLVNTKKSKNSSCMSGDLCTKQLCL